MYFYGDPIVENTAKIFHDVVHLAAAVQESADKAFRIGEPGIEPDKALDVRNGKVYWQCDGFPRLLKEMCENHGKKSSFRICCNFDPGCPLDEYRISQMIDSFRTGNRALFYGDIKISGEVGTLSPLPCYYELWKENLLPEGA